MHEWACVPLPSPVHPQGYAPRQAAPLPVGEARELPAAEGWALWRSLAEAPAGQGAQ